MDFAAFLEEHRLALLGLCVLQQRGLSEAVVAPQLPLTSLKPAELEDFIDELERLMPVDGMIADLRDWDVRLYDILADDWFFGSAFGPESQVESYADSLAEVFLEQVEQLGLDYDQHSNPEVFAELVHKEALGFVSAWRSGICRHLAGKSSAA